MLLDISDNSGEGDGDGLMLGRSDHVDRRGAEMNGIHIQLLSIVRKEKELN